MQVAEELARASWFRGPSASRLRSALLPPAAALVVEEICEVRKDVLAVVDLPKSLMI